MAQTFRAMVITPPCQDVTDNEQYVLQACGVGRVVPGFFSFSLLFCMDWKFNFRFQKVPKDFSKSYLVESCCTWFYFLAFLYWHIKIYFQWK